MDSTNNSSMNEGMFSAIDQIRQDSKDVRDFVKNVFKDREFKKMSNDKDFIKYLKSIYEGTMIDEEHVKFSNRTPSGTIATGSVQTTKESVNEGKKRFKRQDGIGKAKYTISYHDGKKKHKDGSDFFDIKIFKNKKDLSDFVGTLAKQGYKLTNESVNESASKEAMGIAALTGTRGSAVQDFIDKNRINSRKLFKALKSANLQGRINFASALAGKPNNPNARLTKKLFGEDKKQIKDLVKRVKFEKIFYDVLSTMEKKFGKRKYRIWLEKSLKDFGVNPKHYDYRTNAAAEEKLFQLGK